MEVETLVDGNRISWENRLFASSYTVQSSSTSGDRLATIGDGDGGCMDLGFLQLHSGRSVLQGDPRFYLIRPVALVQRMGPVALSISSDHLNCRSRP